MNSRTNIFFLITFHAKHYLLKNHWVLGLINWIDLLEFMMRLVLLGPEKNDAI